MVQPDTIHEVGNHLVDLTAIGGLAFLAYTGGGEGITGILAGSMVTVALGKKYIDGKFPHGGTP